MEKNRYLDMIQEIFPDAILKTMIKKDVEQFNMFARYDPEADDHEELEQTVDHSAIRKKKKEKNKKKIEISIQKGIDKRKKKLLRANIILGKATKGDDASRKSKKKAVVNINWSKWQDLKAKGGEEAGKGAVDAKGNSLF